MLSTKLISSTKTFADFLDYTWKKEVSVEHFISGFHIRVDKISELNLNDKLKGHLLL